MVGRKKQQTKAESKTKRKNDESQSDDGMELQSDDGMEGKNNKLQSDDGVKYSKDLYPTSSERSRLDGANTDHIDENDGTADDQREETEKNEDSQGGQKIDPLTRPSTTKIGKKEIEAKYVKGESAIVPERNGVTHKESKRSFFCHCIVIFAAVATLSMAIYFQDYLQAIQKGHNFRSKDEFVNLIKKMESSFPKQYPEYWKLLRNSGKRHLDRIDKKDQGDLRPMSLLFVAFEESANLVDCYLENIGKAYTGSTYKTIDSHKFTGSASRRSLDEEIKAGLNGYQKLVIIKNLQILSFDAAQLFMTYADEHNDVHKYPQSVIFMSAVLPFPSSNDRRTDEQRVSKFFVDETWGKQDTMDNKAALWSRVGDGVVIIRNELDNPCKKKTTS